MNGWDELSLGHYDVEHRYIGLDYRQLFLDPIRANITLAHEASHSVMAEFDIGQGGRNIAQVLPYVKHLSNPEKNSVRKALRDAQLFVQEGFATYMEIAHLSSLLGKADALQWADQHLHPDYKERFNKLRFAFDSSIKYRESFTSKLSYIALETGFRKHVFERDLLRTPAALIEYFHNDDLNPNRRLEKMLSLVSLKPWLLLKDMPTIAEIAGITFFPPTSKDEVACFLTYLSSLTPHPRTYLPSQIGETPTGEKLFLAAFENVAVRNLNLDLATTAETIIKQEDFLHYADVITAVFVTEAGKHLIENRSPDQEVALLGFCKTGEKYMTMMSREAAVGVLNGQLRHATILMKQGGFNIANNHSALSEHVRNPNVIMYNSPQLLNEYLSEVIRSSPIVRFSYRHIGASENHPFQTVILSIDGQTPLHITNGFGNKYITELIDTIRTKSKVLEDSELLRNSKELNDLLSVWMGLPWEIDWIKSMLNQDALYHRK